MIYPWQQQQWQWFSQVSEANRLPHAILLHGMAGLGKAKFAEAIARDLLCQNKSLTTPCNEPFCSACRFILGRCHPNVYWVEPEKTGQQIKVDQIREITEFLNQSALQAGCRIVILNTADDMNLNAANALLKTLEEPNAGSMLLLISHELSRLPATIISRCQRLAFSKPKKQEALAWLQSQSLSASPELLLNLAHGSPLKAVHFHAEESMAIRQLLFKTMTALAQQQIDPLEGYKKIPEADLLVLLDWLIIWCMDLLHLQLGSREIKNLDYEAELLSLAKQTNYKNNFQLLEKIKRFRGQVSSGINLNKQLVLENIFIAWQGEVEKERRAS